MTAGGDGFWDPLPTDSDTLDLVAVSAGDNYEAWPKILYDASTGDHVAIFNDGSAHSGTTDHVVKARRSTDLGTTWGSETTIDSDASYAVDCFSAGYDSDGNLILWTRRRTSNDAADMVNHKLLRSTDGGVSWSTVTTFVGSPIPRVVWDIIDVPTVGLMCWWNDSASLKYGILTSADDGTTWTQTTIGTAASTALVPSEGELIYLGDGKILCLARTEDTVGNGLWHIESDDYGATWTVTESNIADAYRAPVAFAPHGDGRWLDVYYYDRTTGNLQWIRVDAADIWGNPTSWPSPTTLYTGATGLDSSYCDAVRIATRNIVVFYEGDSSATQIKALTHEVADDRAALTLGDLANVDLTGDEVTGATVALVRDPDLPADDLRAWRLGTISAAVTEADVRDVGRWEVVVSGTPAAEVTTEDQTDWLYTWVTD